jgi:hypothetical protein
MEAASEAGEWDYYVMLSGADYPIRSHSEIIATLSRGGEFINARPGFRPSKPESRVRRYWMDGFDRRRWLSPRTWLFRGVEILLLLAGIRKRRYPFAEVFSGVVWGALSGGCVRWMLDYLREHPRYVLFFRTALVPEEMFFATLVGASPFAGRIRGTVTFMDWDHPGASPPRIGPEHLPRLAPEARTNDDERGHDRLFARKFDDRSGTVLDYIDLHLRA